jgi:hypothetical protein
MNQTNHYQTLKVAENAKPYIIEAAYNALLKDVESLNGDVEYKQKIKSKLGLSYAVLSDPAKKSAYDNSLKNINEIEVKKTPILENNINKTKETEKLITKVEHTNIQIKNNANDSIKARTAVENKKNIPKFNYIKTSLISLGILTLCVAGYMGYKFYPNNIQENTNSTIKKIEDTELSSKKDSIDNSLSNKSIEEEKIKKEEISYNSAIETEKKSDVERLNSRMNRRDSLLAKQDDIEFDDFDQQARDIKKVMKADMENIATMQQSIQDYDSKIQDKIRENSRIEQEEAEAFSKAESTIELEISKITAEQVEIDHLLSDNDRKSKELTKKLINI